MKTLTADQIKPDDLIEINVSNDGRENWQWALVIVNQDKEGNQRSFFVKVGGLTFWTEDFDATHEFNVLIHDGSEVSIWG